MRLLLSVLAMVPALSIVAPVLRASDILQPVRLSAQVSDVQPMTGIALWATNAEVRTSPIQLEFSYLTYDKVVTGPGTYNWAPLEKLLNDVASRGHQSIIRWHDTYVGQPTGVPAYIKSMPDYHEVTANSEGQPTGFPDWSHAQLRRGVLEFFSQYARKYDRDPRIAFVQVGFGLWSEYHIYDGPLKLGQTFPSLEFQAEFARHLGTEFRETYWMISVDAAGEHTPFASEPALRSLPFGLFDDSFNHARHQQENEPNWKIMGRDRWKIAPLGGEFSFFESKDQRLALSPQGPHGIPFSRQAAAYHLTFIVGDDQPRFQKSKRIREAGLSCGYRFRIQHCAMSASRTEVTIENTGIAPFYYDAYPAMNGIRSQSSLKGLLPGQSRRFDIAAGGSPSKLTIESDRLVPGQRIQFDADLR